jgi:hypothetical protein
MATSQEIYSQINQAINPDNSTKKPTVSWVAGQFRKAHDFSRIERVLKDRGDELDFDTRQTYENIIKLRDIAVANGLVTDTNGVYKMTPKGSKFVQDMAQNISKWDSINDMNYKEIRGMVQSAKGDVDREWYEQLPPNEKAAIDLYSRLTLKEFHFLTGLKNDKDGKNQYVNRINTLEERDPESYATLRDLNVINRNNTLNNEVVSNLFRTLGKYDYNRLRSFNRNISSRSDRLAADKALLTNTAIKKNPELGTLHPRFGQETTRQGQRSNVLGGRQQTFNDRMRRTRPANESKNLSFKQFLTENA